MMKEFKQLNDGEVPGNPVTRPIDVTSLTPIEKEGIDYYKFNEGEVWRSVERTKVC